MEGIAALPPRGCVLFFFTKARKTFAGKAIGDAFERFLLFFLLLSFTVSCSEPGHNM